MANWCYGTITVSGKKDNVERFIRDGLQPVTRRPPNKYTLHIYDIAESEYYSICEKLEKLLSIRACTKCKRGKQ